jgi:Beta-propeller repeat
MATDRFGNSLKTARNLNNAGTNLFTGRDSIGSSDRDDLSRFGVSQRSSLELTLSTPRTASRRTGAIGVDVFRLKAVGQRVLRRLTQTDFSNLKPKDLKAGVTFLGRSRLTGSSRSLSLTLDSGEYFFRIHRSGPSRTYRLAATLTPLPATNPTQPDPSPSGPGLPNPGLPNPGSQPGTNPGGSTDGTNPGGTPPAVRFNRSWIRQFGTTANDYLYGLSVSRDGSKLFVSGSTDGGVTNPATGTTATNQGDRDSFAGQFTTAGDPQWLRQFGSTGLDVAYSLVSDSSDRYYAAGVRVVPGSLPNPNGYLAQFNSAGVEQGTRITLNTTVANPLFIPPTLNAADALSGVALDPTGDIIVAGFVQGIPSVSNSKAVVIKYDGTTQVEEWRAELDLPRSSGVAALTLDQSGNIYVTGLSNATLTTDFINPLTGSDVFVAKLNNANGTTLWSRTLETPQQDEARSIAVDLQGNVYVTGTTLGTLPGQTSAGNVDSFLVKYDTSGGLQWLKQFGSAGLDESQAVAVDRSGRIYLTGETTGSLFGNTSVGQSDTWIAAYSNNGDLIANTLIGTASNEETYNITVSDAGRIYVVGQTQGDLAGTGNLGGYDAWIAEYTLS